jgi:hypothetical protein
VLIKQKDDQFFRHISYGTENKSKLGKSVIESEISRMYAGLYSDSCAEPEEGMISMEPDRTAILAGSILLDSPL